MAPSLRSVAWENVEWSGVLLNQSAFGLGVGGWVLPDTLGASVPLCEDRLHISLQILHDLHGREGVGISFRSRRRTRRLTRNVKL